MTAVINENLYQVLLSRFPTDPEAPCLILSDGRVVSYGMLQQESARFAGLLTSLGVQAGDRVAVQVRKSPQALFLYLGCLRAGAVYLPLNDAYQRRDQVGLVVFQREEARVVLPPTSSVELAQRALRDIPVGGKTPLSAGLLAAFRVCTLAQRRDPETKPLIIILTDGAGNVSVTGMPPQEEAGRMALMIKDSHFRTIVVNMEHPAFDRGLAQQLANALGGPCYALPELKADALVKTVKGELDAEKGTR
jgi:acyl-CoA synthetase (AMP-forming)/AMP-acid ligase II